jgi:hypothetical protein
MQPSWHGAPATFLGSWSSPIFAGDSTPVFAREGDILFILQAAVVHVKACLH